MRGWGSDCLATRVSTLIATVVALGAAAGCSSSTSPSGSGFALAEHFDSLAMRAADSGSFDRSQLLSYPTAVLAEGVTPASVSISVNGSAVKYQALAAALVYEAAGVNTDSNFVIIAWRGTNVDELIFLEASASGSVTNLGYYPDTTAVTFGNVTMTTSFVTSGGACRSIDLAFAADLLQGATCTQAKIQSSFDAQIQVAPSTSFATYVLSPTPLPGVRLVIPASPSATDGFRILHPSRATWRYRPGVLH